MSSTLLREALSLEVDPSSRNLREHLTTALWHRQAEDGHWHYALDDNITMNSEYIFFLHWMDEEDDPCIQRLAHFLIQKQSADGSWNIFEGGEGNLSASVEAYFALRLAGFSTEHECLQRARLWICNQGGIPKARVFTKIWLSLFGLYSWEGVPIIPPEIMLSPRGTPFNIYEFSYWSRTVIIPLTILFDVKRMKRVDFTVDELYPTKESKNDLSIPEPLRVDESWIIKKRLWDIPLLKWDQVFHTINQGVVFYENKVPIKPLRQQALEMAKKWILQRQDEAGDWGGIVPAMMNSVMALYATGESKEHSAIIRGMQALKRLTRGVSSSIVSHRHENKDSATLQSCVSPIWDSALAALALLESGVNPQDERLQRVRTWLWDNRITKKSDWALKAKLKKGQSFAAWCFQYHNSFYPDLDDSTVTTLVLYKLGMSKEQLRPALHWIFAMQNSDGGWGTFDRDNNQWILNEIPFADLKSLIDPSNPDVTGHVLETLGELGFGGSAETEAAIRYLKQVQRPDGSWFGRWGVHTLYGTCAAVVGMRKCGEAISSPSLQRALQFILSRQNSDGGWGEHCESYHPENETGRGHSTPSQTAWSLMTLQAMRRHPQEFSNEYLKALQFLKTRVIEDGLHEPEFTGTGFPLHFYLRYDGYRNYFPLIALGRWAQI